VALTGLQAGAALPDALFAVPVKNSLAKSGN
jgi:hypothetical protein